MSDQGAVTADRLTQLRELIQRAPDAEQLEPIGLSEVVSGPGALAELPRVIDDLSAGTVVMLSDGVPKGARSGDLLDAVSELVGARREVRRVVLAAGSDPSGGSGLVHADETTIVHAVEAVGLQSPEVLVTVGSGTIADIGKVIAQRLDISHVVVQTAASVNGFADDQSVLLINGTKRTTPSRWPDALVIDSEILARAPLAMTRSGLGDLLSTYTAAADWRLAATVGFDPAYSPTAVEVLRSGIESVVAAAGDLASSDPKALHLLAAALTQGGLAMGIAGRTSPSSGAEHTISHLLEMRATAQHRVAPSHGSQVGVATVVVARLWSAMRSRLLAGGLEVRPLDVQEMRDRVLAAFRPLDGSGAMAAECWAAYERKLDWINHHGAELTATCEEWSRHDKDFGQLLEDPSRLGICLGSAGAATTFGQLEPPPDAETVRWAVSNCHLMRDRFTIVDLAEVTGCWTDDLIGEVLA